VIVFLVEKRLFILTLFWEHLAYKYKALGSERDKDD